MTKSNKKIKWILKVSIILNMFFCIIWLWNMFNSPTYKYGVLTEDVNVSLFMNDTTLFKLPKGITVKDVSPRGIDAIGRFENNRFEIIITTDKSNIVKYNTQRENLYQYGNHYSINNKKD